VLLEIAVKSRLPTRAKVYTLPDFLFAFSMWDSNSAGNFIEAANVKGHAIRQRRVSHK
jgi:hypothetical protein